VCVVEREGTKERERVCVVEWEGTKASERERLREREREREVESEAELHDQHTRAHERTPSFDLGTCGSDTDGTCHGVTEVEGVSREDAEGSALHHPKYLIECHF
jgi:hypothetical protein